MSPEVLEFLKSGGKIEVLKPQKAYNVVPKTYKYSIANQGAQRSRYNTNNAMYVGV